MNRKPATILNLTIQLPSHARPSLLANVLGSKPIRMCRLLEGSIFSRVCQFVYSGRESYRMIQCDWSPLHPYPVMLWELIGFSCLNCVCDRKKNAVTVVKSIRSLENVSRAFKSKVSTSEKRKSHCRNYFTAFVADSEFTRDSLKWNENVSTCCSFVTEV